MANREENLKKINAELEQLSDEELENVAGGTWNDTADDAKFFHALNGSTPFLRGIEVAFSRTEPLLNTLKRMVKSRSRFFTIRRRNLWQSLFYRL